MIQTTLLYFVVILKILFVIVIIGIIYSFVSPNKQKISQPTSIEITKGLGVKEIGQLLKDNDVINSKWKFYYQYIIHRRPLQTGIFRIEKDESVESIYNKISKGDIYEEEITVIEGWRSEQIAQMLNKKELIDYEAFMELAEGKEGTLFPDTYRVAKKTTTEMVINMLTSNYKERVKGLNPTNEQLIIASIIEREAKKNEDRATMASVFYNRLAKGMKLEADPTVQYAIDNDRLDNVLESEIKDFEFWQPLEKRITKTVISPYNTYRVNTLPPAPICNPGLKSIEAAVKPAQTDYYYFVTDKDGKAHFARTKSEHDVNITKYLN